MNSIEIHTEDIRQTTSNLFFIVGTSRSGSTLLQSMLNMHSKITIPPETHFFHSYRHLKKHFCDGNSKFYLKDIARYWHYNKTRMRDLNIPLDSILDNLERLNLTTPADLFILYLTFYRLIRQKEVVGEKTPKHIRHVDEILKLYPNAKIISLFRDPRATANSEINAQFGSPSVIVTTKRWREYIEIHHELTEKLPATNYMMIQYRNLISRPSETLKRVVNLLGWKFEPRMLNYYNREPAEKGFSITENNWKYETLEPLKKDKNEKWKEQLNTWQVSLIENTAGHYLREIGYDSQSQQLNLVSRILYSMLDLSRSLWANITRERDEGYREPNRFMA